MPNDPYVSLGRYFIRKKNISEGVAGTLQGGITGGAANRRLAQQLLHKSEADRISKNVERAMKRQEANAKARQKEIDTKAAAAQKDREERETAEEEPVTPSPLGKLSPEAIAAEKAERAGKAAEARRALHGRLAAAKGEQKLSRQSLRTTLRRRSSTGRSGVVGPTGKLPEWTEYRLIGRLIAESMGYRVDEVAIGALAAGAARVAASVGSRVLSAVGRAGTKAAQTVGRAGTKAAQTGGRSSSKAKTGSTVRQNVQAAQDYMEKRKQKKEEEEEAKKMEQLNREQEVGTL